MIRRYGTKKKYPTKNNNLPDHASILTDNVRALEACFSRVFKTVAGRIGRKYNLPADICKNLASVGVEYAARYFLNGNASKRLTEKDLTNIAVWKACNATKDLFEDESRRLERAYLDATVVNEDGDTFEESPAIGRYSLLRDRETAYRSKWFALGDYAYNHLEEMFDRLGLSPLRREVFRAIYLEERPVAETSERCGIKPNHAYGIVFAVKNGLAKIGPEFLRAA